MTECKMCKTPMRQGSKSKGVCKACIIKERDDNPTATLQQIANKCGGSCRQYIHLVLTEAGKNTRSTKHNTKKNKIKHKNMRYICPRCGTNKVQRAVVCWDCYYGVKTHA